MVRDMLASPSVAKGMRMIFDSINAGVPVVVRMQDGTEVTLDSINTATATLIHAFDWQPDHP